VATARPSDQRSLSRKRQLAQQLAGPLRSFIATEAGSAGLLLAATVAALVWANSPLSDSYEDLWGTVLELRLGDDAISLDLRHWVNDGLMVFFFFVVGLEVRRELAMGELTDRSRLRIPVIAALAGIVVPAAIYLALNPSGAAAQGWGVAISTDTAFVLGVLALIGSSCPTQLRVFLLTLSIVDVGVALAIIAVFYSDHVSVLPLAGAAACAAVILLLGRLRVWRGPAYFVVGAVRWGAMLESGVHPAIAGVVIAACIAVYPPRREEVERAAVLARAFRQSPVPELARSAKLSVERALSPNERMQELLHPWTSYVVVPIFALANAGVAVAPAVIAGREQLMLAIVAGLAVGKPLGILAASAVAVRMRLAVKPDAYSWRQLAGAGALAGIGFTMSLFIAGQAFADAGDFAAAKLAVFAGSILAAIAGTALLWSAAAPEPDPAATPQAAGSP
jgi:NhaA family Na+:H+ antiporter